MSTPLKMKDLEARTDVSREAIHFYLREGLLPEPERPKRNVALYTEEHVNRIRLIKQLQEERFLPLSVIRELLSRADVAAEAGGGLAAFELTLSSLLNGDAPEPDQPLEAVAERSGMDSGAVRALVEAGVIQANVRDGVEHLDFRDAAIVEHWGRLLESGFRDLPGYDETYLARFAQAIEPVAAAEVDLFLETFGSELTGEAAARATRGIAIANEIFSRMRTQALMRALAARVAEAGISSQG